MKKRFAVIILCTVMLLVTASCTNAPPQNAREELLRHDWQIIDQTGKVQGTVCFREGTIHLEAGNLHLSEEYLINDSAITFYSQTYGAVSLSYVLSGNTMQLTYFGKTVTLKKK